MERIVNESLREWNSNFKDGVLALSDMEKCWRILVAAIFSPLPNTSGLKIAFDEELAQKMLFHPLEVFMCGGEPKPVHDMIFELDNPPSLCGRVFKTGDPTYGCRDCGMDPTCVLCADCFKNSAHKMHRYKISTSSGGGYCDCGDQEAWRYDAFCDIHIKGQILHDSECPLTKLPCDLVERIRVVFDYVLQYAAQCLSDEAPEVPYEVDTDQMAYSGLVNRDVYTTMLYNDEIHSYQDVIAALESAIHCTKKDASAFATLVDREGRAVIHCGDFQQCCKVKDSVMEPVNRRIPKSLNVKVLHSFMIAHQTFASRLLDWLNTLLQKAQTFRLIFSEIASRHNCLLIENVFRSNTRVWKMARIQWQRLLISGMLMEIDSKKIFARMFAKNYSGLMKEFIQDDHEHSVCIISLTVQLFTMPTIAHMLITEEDVLARVLITFLSECRDKVKDGKLNLEVRSSATNMFRRIQYALYDLKYLLSVKLEVWTSNLRKGFLHGYSKLLELCAIMQGMDPVVRQVGQHIEYEPEWEPAFNLYIKLSSLIPHIIEWCASDRVVLIKAYRILLGHIGNETKSNKYITREFLNYSVSCIEYNVSDAPVSIHLPLSRLLAGLTLELQKYDLNYNSPEFSVKGRPCPEALMEPVLRARVMIAQVNAGMWRRNGFSLSNQIYFYHNIRCRQEMLDRDVMLLQIAATLLDSNEFLIHILNKFNLRDWVKHDFEHGKSEAVSEEGMKQKTTLAEEFLQLINVLVSERFTPGIGVVTKADCVKKEIIQLLCIEPMPHSMLIKLLPEGPNHETGIENVIGEVANFKKPSEAGKGIFELKNEFYSHYNLFFYHYTRDEQNRSEFALRAKRKAGDLDCCPPPQLPPLTESFVLLVNILQCDVFLHIIKTVLIRIGTKSRSVSETQFHLVLHMIGYALHEEQKYISMNDPYFHFTKRAAKHNIVELLHSLVGNSRISVHKDLLNWTVNKYHDVINMSYQHDSSSVPPTVQIPVSVATSSATEEKVAKDSLAAQRKAKILAKIAAMQKNFIKCNETLFKDTSSSEPTVSLSNVLSPMDCSEPLLADMVAVGYNQSQVSKPERLHTCILCHQIHSVDRLENYLQEKDMVFGCFVQQSTVLSCDRTKMTNEPYKLDTLVLPTDFHWGVHISSCGHAMHRKCWNRFFEDLHLRESRRPVRVRNIHNFDTGKGEFLCPLCESLCNSSLPLLPPITASVDSMVDDAISYTEVFRRWYSQLDEIITCSASLTEGRKTESADHVKKSVINYGRSVFQNGFGVDIEGYEHSVPFILCSSTAYTVHTFEQTQRHLGKALLTGISAPQKNCMNAVISAAASYFSHIDNKQLVKAKMHTAKLLALLVDGTNCSASLLEWDAFSALVCLVLGMAVFIPDGKGMANGSVQALFILELCFFAHVMQILMTYDANSCEEEGTEIREEDSRSDCTGDANAEWLASLYTRCHTLLSSDKEKTVDPLILAQHVRESCLPFLRCCGIFFHFLTEIPILEELQSSVWVPESEFYCLLRYLGLSNHFREMHAQPVFENILEKWCQHPNIQCVYHAGIKRRWTTINDLVPLPKDYSELMNKMAQFPCPNSTGNDTRTHTMCLVCGKLLCSQSYCCHTEFPEASGKMIGACTHHAYYCSASNGLFLTVHKCKVLLLSGQNKGCYISAPYLDEYGETDLGLRRGYPLHLDEKQYMQLCTMWLSHKIPNKVSHNMHATPDPPEWHLL